MSISVPEGLMEKADEQPPADVPSVLPAEDRPAEGKGFGRCRKRGRPTAAVKNDLTLARIHHMRFMNVPVETIAKEIGVSKRTFYRRWNQIGDPFQQVDLITNPLCQKSLIFGTPLIFGTLVC